MSEICQLRVGNVSEYAHHTDCLALVDDREQVFADVATGDDALLLLGGGDCGDGVGLLYHLHTAFTRLGTREA